MNAQNIKSVNNTALTKKGADWQECLAGGTFVGPEVVILSFAGNCFSKVSFYRKKRTCRIGNIREL